MQNKLDETSKLTYDERRKILLQEKSNTTEYKTDEVIADEENGIEAKPSILMATVKHITEVQHTEPGIKLAYKGLVDEKKNQDKLLIDSKNGLKDAGEMTPELQKLKNDMAKITKIDKVKVSKEQIKTTEERLKFLNGEIKDLKEEIGTRLKL